MNKEAKQTNPVADKRIRMSNNDESFITEKETTSSAKKVSLTDWTEPSRLKDTLKAKI